MACAGYEPSHFVVGHKKDKSTIDPEVLSSFFAVSDTGAGNTTKKRRTSRRVAKPIPLQITRFDLEHHVIVPSRRKEKELPLATLPEAGCLFAWHTIGSEAAP